MRRLLSVLVGLLALLPAPTAAADAPDFAQFQGAWGGHGRVVEITPDGEGVAELRTYRWCDDGYWMPCDTTIGGEIVSGTRIRFQLTSVSDTVATGRIQASTDPRYPYRAVIGVARLDDGTLGLYHGVRPRQITVLCNDQAPEGACGG